MIRKVVFGIYKMMVVFKEFERVLFFVVSKVKGLLFADFFLVPSLKNSDGLSYAVPLATKKVNILQWCLLNQASVTLVCFSLANSFSLH